MNKEDRVIELDLLQLVRVLWEKGIYIVIATVVFGLLGFMGSKLLKTPIYQASAKMIVNTQAKDTQNVSSDRLNSAKNLVDTYAIIIRDRDVINRVIEELALTESYGQIASCVSVKAVNNTQIMQVIVQHPNRATAFAIAEKIQEIAPNVIMETVGVGSVKAVGQAYSGSAPVSPNNKKDAVLMALVGFVLACGVIVVLFLLDNTYKSDLEIQSDLNVPVLGVIPKVECCGKYSKYGYRYGYGYGYGHTSKAEKKAKEGK